MNETSTRSYQDCLSIEAPSYAIYDLVSDITRTGEWSPVCTGCWWDIEEKAGQVGAWFTGRNEIPGRTWETQSKVVAAERGQKFAWVVGGEFVRWSFTLSSEAGMTLLTESWTFLPAGIAMFEKKYGDGAPNQIADRTREAVGGIPKTLAAIKRIVESADAEGGLGS